VKHPGAKARGFSWRWMAPETINELSEEIAELSAAADIFCFGRTAFYVVTGEPPLANQKKADVRRLIKNKVVPSLQWPEQQLSLQAECQSLCDKCLITNPDLRADARQICDELLSWCPRKDGDCLSLVNGLPRTKAWSFVRALSEARQDMRVESVASMLGRGACRVPVVPHNVLGAVQNPIEIRSVLGARRSPIGSRPASVERTPRTPRRSKESVERPPCPPPIAL